MDNQPEIPIQEILDMIYKTTSETNALINYVQQSIYATNQAVVATQQQIKTLQADVLAIRMSLSNQPAPQFADIKSAMPSSRQQVSPESPGPGSVMWDERKDAENPETIFDKTIDQIQKFRIPNR